LDGGVKLQIFGGASTDTGIGTYMEVEMIDFCMVANDDVVTLVAGWWMKKHGENKNNNRAIK